MKAMTIILAGVLAFAVGCESGERISLTKQIDTLRTERRGLERELEQFEAEKQQFKGQLRALAGLEGKIFENIYQVERVEVTRYTNLYDKDKDGRDEKLIVYIQPIDEQGDIVKATGEVDVQLWDLDRAAGEALLAKWHVGPGQLQQSWSATLLAINYRLVFDVPDELDAIEGPLTVKVGFTDYLTGKVFKEQKTIKP
ncbi:MAG: hypothetical protein ACYSRZ_06155 [Planctomycetota bacterium]|jgi:hypothetical protein